MTILPRLLIAASIASLPLQAGADTFGTDQQWARQVRQVFIRNFAQPTEARPGISIVEVEVIVRRDGRVRHSRIYKSSGFEPTDAAVRLMLARTARLPAFPPGMNAAETKLRLPIVFQNE